MAAIMPEPVRKTMCALAAVAAAVGNNCYTALDCRESHSERPLLFDQFLNVPWARRREEVIIRPDTGGQPEVSRNPDI